MGFPDASLELLSHFDRPAAQERTVRSRGVGWVLHWAAAIATLFFAVALLTQFGYCLAAERSLARAARAGALEATLPRATYQSVAQVIERRLTGYPPALSNRLRFSLQRNGAPVRGLVQPGADDRLAVTLAAPTREFLPRWLPTAVFWPAESQITVHAERRVPGRRLAAR